MSIAVTRRNRPLALIIPTTFGTPNTAGIPNTAGLLVLIYGMLSFIAFFDQDFFYDSMEIPVPADEFLLWSWGGKNTAMLVALLAAVITRHRLLMVVALGVLLTGQIGDINAGAQSGVNVFITWIALGLVVAQTALMATTGHLKHLLADN